MLGLTMAGPVCRSRAHAKGVTFANYDSKRRVVTCGGDEEVHIYPNLGGESDEDVTEFELSTSRVSAMVCYRRLDGSDVIAVAMDDNTVQAFSTEGSSEGLLMRFTAPITSLAINEDHTLLGAGSSDFSVKVLELHNLPSSFSLTAHEAPVLSVCFDPHQEFLASSSCDGTVRVWSLSGHSVVKALPVLPKSNDVSLSASLCQLAWGAHGDVLAIPVGSEVQVYRRDSWICVYTLSDLNHHKEAINVVSWSLTGEFLVCADVRGHVSLWQTSNKTLRKKMQNEDKTGITALEWEPGNGGNNSTASGHVMFADRDGYVGMFDVTEETTNQSRDLLAEDSLLMEGIPDDDIFGGFDDPLDDDNQFGNEVDVINEVRESDADDDLSLFSGQSARARSSPRQDGPATNRSNSGANFNEKMVEVYQLPWQPAATPTHLQHRFMVYNMVGMVYCHDDTNTSMVEVDFHDSSTHHSFSLPNSLEHSMAALSHQALALACQKSEDGPSQLQCVHFSSWDSQKDWVIPLPKKESIQAVAIGDGWIAIATNMQLLRLFSVGGVQREVLSVPGHVVTLAGWGPRLSVLYQTPPCTEGVYGLTVWMLDVQHRKQLHLPHTLPISHHSQLSWIGFSEEGCLVTHDSKGMVRIHGNSCYGGSSWMPILDTTAQLANKSDSYFILGMTHQPDELRGILCKGLDYPPVQPRPVMSSLPLSIPLCEPNLERTEHERAYLQELMVFPPAQPRSSSELVQKLMKMFALACKSGREFKAWEIAGMLPDHKSMALAMTYASRTQHVRLARQINELMQQKALDNLDSDIEEEEEEEVADREWDHYNGHNDGGGSSSNIIAKRGMSAREPPSKGHLPPLRMISKFGRQKVIKSAVVGGTSQTCWSGAANETAELFSDSEEAPREAESADIQSGSEDEDRNMDEDESDEGEKRAEEEEKNDSLSPRAFGDSSLKKRPNPFKLTTPVSKKISVERQHGFLRKISAHVDEERKNKQARNVRKEKGSATSILGTNVGASGKRTRGAGGDKKKTSSAPQKILKGAFLKTMQPLAEPTSTTNAVLKGNGVKDVEQPHEASQSSVSQKSLDASQKSCDGDTEPSADREVGGSIDGKLTTAQKLANFAFTQIPVSSS